MIHTTFVHDDSLEQKIQFFKKKFKCSNKNDTMVRIVQELFIPEEEFKARKEKEKG